MSRSKTNKLRELIASKTFLHMPAVYDPLGARMVEQLGFEAVYCGGYVSGASRAITEPLLTMTEQIAIAADAAASVDIPMMVDAGAGFGEPLHTMRTTREFIRAGIASIHIEDQLYPKRAHYHTYQVHAVSVEEFVDKIRYATKERDQTDPDFVIVARSDVGREFGLEAAIDRVNRAADVGADLSLVFPRDKAEAERAPRISRLPLIYVMSRGNRDGRPIFTRQELEQMGYAGCIEAQIMVLTAFDANMKALQELRSTGAFTGLSQDDTVALRKGIEDLIRLDEYYEIERDTVEK